jgi:hypothetical protein
MEDLRSNDRPTIFSLGYSYDHFGRLTERAAEKRPLKEEAGSGRLAMDRTG